MQFQEVTIHANHLDFALKIWGEDDAPVIFALHGWLDNAASFDLLAPLMSGYRIIAVDQCGHGKSSHRPPGVPYYFVDYVADVFYIADALDIHDFILLGHSMGANVASMMAATFPERVRALMLVEGFGPATRDVDQTISGLRESIEKFSGNESAKRRYAEFSSLVKARLQGHWPLTEEAAHLLCERGSVEKDGLYTWSSDPRINYSSPMRLTTEQGTFVRSKIECPTQIIVADEGIVPEFLEDKAPLNEFKHATVSHLPGKHHLHMERDHVDAVANTLNAFLKSRKS